MNQKYLRYVVDNAEYE